jgi:DNA-directed RNA polymerase specialized sigma subunit
MLDLRFEQGLTLRKTGEILDIGDARRVHERLAQLLAQLRKTLLASGLSAIEYLERRGPRG